MVYLEEQRKQLQHEKKLLEAQVSALERQIRPLGLETDKKQAILWDARAQIQRLQSMMTVNRDRMEKRDFAKRGHVKMALRCNSKFIEVLCDRHDLGKELLERHGIPGPFANRLTDLSLSALNANMDDSDVFNVDLSDP